MHSVKEIQERLQELGFRPGTADGIMGPRTERAISEFKQSVGLLARPYYGPKTDAALFGAKQVSDAGSIPPWLVIARSLEGLREIKGSKHNPIIVNMWVQLGLPFRDDETSWCAAFVGHCLEAAGFPSTRSAAARSYEKWKQGIRIKVPMVGAVVTMWRGSQNGWQGHIGFVEGVDQRGRILVRGGNQGDAVNVKPFDRDRITGFFWPMGYPLPNGKAPTVHSNAASSTVEA